MIQKMIDFIKRTNFFWIMVLWLFIKFDILAQNFYTEDNLLRDSTFQHKTAAILNQIYGFQFANAQKLLVDLKRQYPEHPAVPFLYGLMYFWIIDTYHPDKSRDALFLSYMDTVLALTTKMKQPPKTVNVERAFFEFSALAFKARLYALRDQYMKAINLCIKSLPAFQTGLKYKKYSPEFLFSSGMYLYYVKWYGETKPITRPFLSLFPPGNKELGIQEMEKCVSDNNLASAESAVFLMFIYLDEKKYTDALRHGEHLSNLFPYNTFIALLYGKSLLMAGEYSKAVALFSKARIAFEKTVNCYTTLIPISKNLWTSQVMQKMLYYGAISIYKQENDYTEALDWLEKSAKITEMLKNGENGMNALIAFQKGICYEQLQKKTEAIQHYRLALAADNNAEIKKQAESAIQRLEK
ncbi:MAG: tetratricopeptide repeat protein [Bacteroidia bacterium]|nr:tetratricopeptide repeat protein [Bacteroidia bacterium]